MLNRNKILLTEALAVEDSLSSPEHTPNHSKDIAMRSMVSKKGDLFR